MRKLSIRRNIFRNVLEIMAKSLLRNYRKSIVLFVTATNRTSVSARRKSAAVYGRLYNRSLRQELRARPGRGNHAVGNPLRRNSFY